MSRKNPIVTIVTSKSSPRLEYIVHHIFLQFLNIQYSIASSIPADDSIVILYGNANNDQSVLSIPSHELLFQTGSDQFLFNISEKENLQKAMAVPDSEGFTFDFDIFAWLFYLLSRYEEYQSKDLDSHSRYKSSNSLASQYSFLEIPLVDLWILKLTKEIRKKNNVDLWPKKSSRIIPSLDIDMPYAYHRKGLRASVGIFRDILSGNIGGIQDRWRYFTSGKDPFDTYAKLESLLKNYSQVCVFLLHNNNPPHDLNHIPGTIEWQSIIKRIHTWATIGIHPSYESNSRISKLESEKKALEIHVGEIEHSRQHFLKFSLPATYRNLIAIGIKNDHSMLYPDRIGFRASTSVPFLWYDLEREESTPLLIHPYAIMDVTMRYYMKLSPKEAIQKINSLKNDLATVNGNLGFLWHNSSMSRAYGWKKWMPVLLHLLKKR
ncbi:MAG: hypothetical protein ACI9FN_003211 [Saprospiraceae bacterium]|jgi:hypothetical protein